MKTVYVKFDNSRMQYAYITQMGNVKRGDFAVVKGTNDKVCLVEVMRTSDVIDAKATKALMGVINIDAHKKAEELLLEYRDIENNLEDRAKQIAKQQKLRDMVGDDAEGKALLNRLAEIRGELAETSAGQKAEAETTEKA